MLFMNQILGFGGSSSSAALSIAASSVSDVSYNNNHSSMVMLTATKALFVYPGTSNKGTAVIIEISGNVITFGTPTVFNDFSTSSASVCAIDSNTAFVVWNSTITKGGCILSISGSTITANATTTANAPQTLGGTEYAVCAISATTVLIGWYQASGSAYSIMAATIAGTTVTFGGTTLNGTETVSSNIYPSFVPLTSTTALFSWFDTVDGAWLVNSVVVTCSSGTTVSLGTSTAVATSVINGAFPFAVAPISSTAALIVYGASASVGYAKVISISGTTVTANTAAQISAAYGFNYGIAKLSEGAFVCAYTKSDSTSTLSQIISVSGTVPTATASNLVTLDSGGAAPDMTIAVLSPTKILYGYERPGIAADTRFKIGNYS